MQYDAGICLSSHCTGIDTVWKEAKLSLGRGGLGLLCSLTDYFQQQPYIASFFGAESVQATKHLDKAISLSIYSCVSNCDALSVGLY